MSLKVVVWGTGNVGRPAIRAVLSHSDLTLAGVIVASPDKVGLDAGEIAGVAACGVPASDQVQAVLSADIDAVVYAATADTRPEAAMQDLMACLEAGINVVSPAFYAFLHPASTPEDLRAQVQSLCNAKDASLLVSGIDPGWAMDMLPVVLSGAVSGITEIRSREIFNYALYDQPAVVRDVIGFGGSMQELPLMLHDFAIEMVWAPMLRLVGEALGKPVERVAVQVERVALGQDVDVPGMGRFEAGTQGAFRFEIQGFHGEQALYALEHVTRIDDNCAPHWPYPPQGQGCHQVIISGTPRLEVSLHAHDEVEPGVGGGGNASAASWLVNAIPAVCAGNAGIRTVLDLPRITGAAQVATAS